VEEKRWVGKQWFRFTLIVAACGLVNSPNAHAQQAKPEMRLTFSDVAPEQPSGPLTPVFSNGDAYRIAQAPVGAAGSSTKPMPSGFDPNSVLADASQAPSGSSDSETIGIEELAKRVAEIQSEDVDYQPSSFFTEYDGGFKISPRDKKKTPFELKINGRLQFRWVGFARDSETFTNRTGTIGVPTRNDFEVERGRLEFKGYAVNPRIKYYFNLDADTDDNHDVIFHDFWFDYDVSDHLTVRVGKAKVPGSYEWLESSTTTRFSDRSLSTTYFRADRSVGVWFLGKTPKDWNYQVSVTNGFVSTDLEPEDVDNNFNYTGIFYKDILGDVGKGYSDLKSREELAVRVGSSFSYINTNPLDDGSPTAEQDFARVSDGVRLTDSGALAPGVVVNDFDHYLLSSFINGKWRGFSFNAEYYARWLQNFGTLGGASPQINDLFDSGFYVDAGYFLVPGKFEVNGRVSQIDGLFGDTWEYAAGWNWFYDKSHKSKLTFDATVLEGSPTSSSSPNFELGQDGILYRLQYQIAF
jgi:phosphate-selective porin